MKSLKLMKKTSEFALYSLKDRKLLNDKLIEETQWPAPRLVFEFKPGSPKDGYVKAAVSKKYSVRVMYYAAKKDIKLPKVRPTASLALVPARDFKEFSRLNKTTLFREYIRPLRPYLRADFVKECAKFAEGPLRKCRNMVLTRDGRTVGIASTLKARAKGKPGNLVAWIWLDGKLSKTERDGGRLLIAQWLRSHASGLFGTAEHIQSRKTQKFYSALGFRPMRYIVEKM